jgi:6-phosphogluconolactonase (cycloisomerase 2 family)
LQQIYGYTVGASGSLTALSGFPVSAPLTGIGSASYNQQVVITNPTGTLLFISEFGNDQILVYQISSTGALTLATGSPVSTVPAGLQPQNMAMDGKGKFLYVTSESGDHAGSVVAVYSVSSAGALTLASTPAQTLLPCCWEMQGEPSGNFMVGISGETLSIFGSDDNHIYVYGINQTTGLLIAVTGSPFTTTYSPFNIAVDPVSANGEFVYSFSINDTATTDNPIEAYQINTTTGALTVVSGSPYSGVTASPWGQFDQSGGFLFLYAGVAPDFELGVSTVGTNGSLTESVSTTPLTTSGYWAVTDVPTTQ